MSEFALIEMIRNRAGGCPQPVPVGMGDDAAVLEWSAERQLVVTMDTLNEGVHFRADGAGEDLGHKALAVNLSDLAAMGASPAWATLSLSMPEADSGWLADFLTGFNRLAEAFDICLVGGDTCAGPRSVSITAMGFVPEGQALLRAGARPGDRIFISGTLGDAALALQRIKAQDCLPETLRLALDRPQPQVRLGQALIGKASACIDVSDGLLADLGHVTSASDCGAEVFLEALPASSYLLELADEQRWALQLGGGDDYQLCFTLPQNADIEIIEQAAEVPLSVIGRIVEQSGIRCVAADGTEWDGHPTECRFAQQSGR